MFCKGALLKDTESVLSRVGENSQASRWIRYTSVQQILGMKSVLKNYIREAIEAEKAGLQVKYKTTAEFRVPEEFQKRLDEDAPLKAAFDALTPGRQRGYLLHFSAPKQSKTRESRVAKCAPQILKEKG